MLHATFEKCVYPKAPTSDSSEYRICRFCATEAADGIAEGEFFSVKGHGLPRVKNMSSTFVLEGKITSDKWGKTMNVETCKEEVKRTKEGIIGYLCSGTITGIGPVLARRIYDTFGLDAMEILDRTPNRIREVPGIGEKKAKKIEEALVLQSSEVREIMQLLIPHGVSVSMCWKIWKKYGKESKTILREKPYILCENYGIGFYKADQIAMAAGLNPHAQERVCEGIIHVLKEAENGGSLFREGGSLCISKETLIEKATELLSMDGCQIDKREIALAGTLLMQFGRMVKENGMYYRSVTHSAETFTADRLKRQGKKPSRRMDLVEKAVADAEAERKIRLGKEQREAVKRSLASPISIITGGPGTGKTTIVSVLLLALEKLISDPRIILMAPTGRAARRLTESTGRQANTIHRELGLYQISEEDHANVSNNLEADMVVVDETSMVDIFLAEKLLLACDSVSQLVFVGDIDQLPSVGPGSFLREMISSNQIPTTRLQTIYRQESMSSIAINAARIRVGKTTLEEAESFQIIEVDNEEESVNRIISVYADEVKRVGQQDVVLLCPLRKSGLSCVNAMNQRLQELMNPLRENENEVVIRRDKIDMHFRVADPVMMTRNTSEYANGDTGKITRIEKDEDGDYQIEILLDVGGDCVIDKESIENLSLSYATTVHKSQGSEYKVVITTLQMSHYVMLRRNLIYTCITRARDKIIYIGSRKALKMAIFQESLTNRISNLSLKIC